MNNILEFLRKLFKVNSPHDTWMNQYDYYEGKEK